MSFDFKKDFVSNSERFHVDTSGLNEAVSNAFNAIEDGQKAVDRASREIEKETAEYKKVSEEIKSQFDNNEFSDDPFSDSNFNAIVNELVDSDEKVSIDSTNTIKAVILAHVLSDMGYDDLEDVPANKIEEFIENFQYTLTEVILSYNGTDDDLSFNEFTRLLEDAQADTLYEGDVDSNDENI